MYELKEIKDMEIYNSQGELIAKIEHVKNANIPIETIVMVPKINIVNFIHESTGVSKHHIKMALYHKKKRTRKKYFKKINVLKSEQN